MHRLGLSETVLVFPEHRVYLGNEALADSVERLRRAAPEKTLVIEATSIADALEASGAGFDVIQAEKFTPSDIAALVSELRRVGARPRIAAAGGINRENAADYARAGADILVTSAPYFARPRDVAVTIEAASR